MTAKLYVKTVFMIAVFDCMYVVGTSIASGHFKGIEILSLHHLSCVLQCSHKCAFHWLTRLVNHLHFCDITPMFYDGGMILYLAIIPSNHVIFRFCRSCSLAI